jgi:hypothetical protein
MQRPGGRQPSAGMVATKPGTKSNGRDNALHGGSLAHYRMLVLGGLDLTHLPGPMTDVLIATAVRFTPTPLKWPCRPAPPVLFAAEPPTSLL